MANVIINDTNLTNIANAIREKNGLTDTYKPSEMAGAILAIQGGGGGGDFEWPNPIQMNGTISSSGAYDWVWSQAPAVTIRNSGTSNSFSSSNLEDISNLTIINIGANNLHNYFNSCYYLKELPKFHMTGSINNIGYFFSGCKNLREIPEDWFMLKPDDGTYASTGTLAFNDQIRIYNLFTNCHSLRKHPILHDGTQRNGYMNQSYQSLFNNCFALDEIVNIPVYSFTPSTNIFTYTFGHLWHVKKITFATQEDGTPYTANWSNQTISLCDYVGYSFRTDDLTTAYNSGIPTAAKVDRNGKSVEENIAVINQYPDDWWSVDENWSRYALTEAVETINSLPDCSAGSGNVITFNGAATSPSSGAISTMTEEQIAVATAKGWTVSMI